MRVMFREYDIIFSNFSVDDRLRIDLFGIAQYPVSGRNQATHTYCD